MEEVPAVQSSTVNQIGSPLILDSTYQFQSCRFHILQSAEREGRLADLLGSDLGSLFSALDVDDQVCFFFKAILQPGWD